jgi:hypothetical protein
MNESNPKLGRTPLNLTPPAPPQKAQPAQPQAAPVAPTFNWTPDAVYKVGLRLMFAWFGLCFVLGLIFAVIGAILVSDNR